MSFFTSLFRRVFAKKTTNKEPEPLDYRGLDDRDDFQSMNADNRIEFYTIQANRYDFLACATKDSSRRKELLSIAWNFRTRALNIREGYPE